jgi:hypothetical protein
MSKFPKLPEDWKWNVDDIVPDETIIYNATDDATAWVETIDGEHHLVVGNGQGYAVGYLSKKLVETLFANAKNVWGDSE